MLAVLAVLGATRLSFDPDLLNLIPQQNKQVNEFRKVLKDLGTIDYHIVVMDMPKGRDVHDYDSLIDAIAEGYRKSPRIEDVTYKIPNPLDFIEIILPKALLFLTPAELDEVAAKLTDDGIRESVARNAAMLQTPQAMAMKPLVQYDPFNLAADLPSQVSVRRRRLQHRHVERLLHVVGSQHAADPDQAEAAGAGRAVRQSSCSNEGTLHRGARR